MITKEQIENAAEPFGFFHSYGNNNKGMLLGNAGQPSYGRGGRVYSARERLARKTATISAAIGVTCAALLVQSPYSPKEVEKSFDASISRLDSEINREIAREGESKCDTSGTIDSDRRTVHIKGTDETVSYTKSDDEISIEVGIPDSSLARIIRDDRTAFVSVGGTILHGLNGRDPRATTSVVKNLLDGAEKAVSDSLAKC